MRIRNKAGILLSVLYCVHPSFLRAADTTAPTVVSISPAPGSTVSDLTQVTVVFSEPVVGVEAWNLQVAGTDAADVTGTGFTNFTFVFTQPLPGYVPVHWDATQTITDQAGNPFTGGSPWNYTLLDTVPPTVVQVSPAAGATVGKLTQVAVTFSEPVVGVSAADLMVNGQPATDVSGFAAGPYLFEFSQPSPGGVGLSWDPANGITDLFSNGFAGGSWTVTLNPAAAPTVRINEFLASNVQTNGLKDEDGDLNGWIELFNYGSTPVNLAGFALTDSAGNPANWILPGTNLGAGQFLIVFASGKDRRLLGTTNLLHTNFKLNPDGGYLGLFNAESPPAALTEFNPQYPSQRNDYSYGLNPSGFWRYYRAPTPGAPNGDSAITGLLPPVHFSVDRGFFNAPFNLFLTMETPGAAIRYTTDGTLPTESNGLLYTNALTIGHQTTLRAAAFMTNVLPSLVQTHTYIFLDDVIRQSDNQPGVYANLWGTFAPHYQMDPKVVTNQAYAGTIRNDLMAIPTLSIVLNPDDMFGAVNGIYTHSALVTSGPLWTRGCSLELINPDGTTGFQIDCSIKMHGGGSREESKEEKHAFNVGFKAEFGPSTLQYKFFPDSPVTKFNKMILRCEYNNHWTHELDNNQRSRGSMVRDEWFKDTLAAMGSFAGHASYVHLYINGLYWGVYDPCEHQDAAFAASYLGGDKSEYDTIKAGDQGAVANDGNLLARNAMLAIASGNLANPAQYELLKQNLDVTQYADYMVLLLYGANWDWGPQKNWTSLRRRVPGGLWLYLTWDDERTFEGLNDWISPANAPDNLHNLMWVNPEYRMLFADRAQRAFFNGGPLTTNAVIASWKARAAQVDRATVGESARWGEGANNPKLAISPPPYPAYTNSTFYTHNDDWLGEEGRLLTNYFPFRSAFVLNQFRSQGLFPSVAAPGFSQFGGPIPAGYQLYITNNAGTGTVFYTTAGADPRLYGSGAVSSQALSYTNGVPVTLNISTQVKARMLSGTIWSALTEATFLVAELIPPLHITELMYHPIGGDAYEFLELQNTGATPLDLSGYYFSGITFQFPPDSILTPGAVLVLGSNNATNAWEARYPGVSVFGWYGGKLSNNGEQIALHDAHDQIVCSVTYQPAGGWPTLAAGAGYSLEIIDVNGDPNDPANWRASAAINGTPGLAPVPPPSSNISLNELMADNATAINNGGTYPGWVEIYNAGGSVADLSGWMLGTVGSQQQISLPPNTLVPAAGYLVVWCDTNSAAPGLHTGFALNRSGDSVCLYDPAGNRVDAISFGPQLTDYSLGRVGGTWQLTAPTPNGPNVPASLASATNLVINEWLANSVPGGSDWLELFNSSSNAPVALHDLYLGTSNALFQIKSLSFLPPRGYLRLLADGLPGPTHLGFNLPAAGGIITLYGEAGNQVDRISYGAQVQGVSQGRLPDGSSTIVSFPGSASPGAANYLANYAGPFLNEVMANNVSATTNLDGRVADWVEIYNPAANAWTWDGWSLSVDEPQPGQWFFPTGLVQGAQSSLLVWCDGGQPASTAADPNHLNAGRSINKESGGVYLFNPAGQLMDLVEFGFQVQDQSIGKSSGTWQLLAYPTPGAPNSPPAPLGSVNNLRINEWMASPLSGDPWFELFNADTAPVSLSGLYLAGDPSLAGKTNVLIAPLSFMAGQGFVKWVADAHPSNGRNHVAFTLDPLGQTLRLYGAGLSLIDSVDFGLQADGAAQGRLPDGSTNIVTLTTPTPGQSNYVPPPNAVINELLSHADLPLEQAIELFNPSAAALPIGGWFLSDSAANFKKYQIPNGTTLPAGGFWVCYQNQFNSTNAVIPFLLNSAHGGQIYLSAVDAGGNLTGYRATAVFGAAESGVSFGRYDASLGTDFTALSARTFGVDNPVTVEQFRAGTGLSNAAPKVGPIVINEIMYHPPDIGGLTDTADEYVELYNVSGGAVPMYDPAHPTNQWRLQNALTFTFTNISIPAGAYVLVVSFDPVANPGQLAAFQARYGLSPSVAIYGPFAGELNNGGGAVELVKPDAPQTGPPDAGYVPYIGVDRVVFSNQPPWPSAADGTPNGLGLSLQRSVPTAYGNDPLSWVAGNPTPGAANGPAFPSLPVITQQPQNTGDRPGGTASFSVAATGGSLGYQWRMNGLNIPGAILPSLTVSNLQSFDQGNYTVWVSGPGGSVLSSAATLTVAPPPSIAQQPQTQTASPGTNVTFSVIATGGALSYQWRFNGVNLPGATNSSLALTNVQTTNVGAYSVLILNAFTPTLSDSAYLVMARPAIVQQPQNQTNYVGNLVTFTVGASGDAPLSYQWRKGATNLPAGTGSSLVLPNLQLADAGGYSAVVSNPLGSATSAVASLTVIVPLQILQQPTNQVVNAASNVTLSVTAIGTGTLRYRWRFNGVNISNNPTATNSSLLLTNVQLADSGPYSVMVTDDLASLTSATAILTVKVKPLITQQPMSLTVAAGSTANLTVSATGTFPLGYRWRKPPNYLADGTFVLSSNASVYSITNVQASNAAVYNVLVTNLAGFLLSSNAFLTVVAPLASQAALAGSTVTFSASATGAAPILYRWQFNSNDLAGATNSNLILTNVQPAGAGTYGVVVTVVTNVPIAPATFSAGLTVLTQPILSLPQFLANGDFQVRLQGDANRSYFIDVSSNLSAWSTLATLAYTNGPMPFSDPAATNRSQRFYRARLAP